MESMAIRSLSMLLALFAIFVALREASASGGVFHVRHKFADQDPSLASLKAHDALRHARILAEIDLPLGGNRDPGDTGLYFTKIGIGTPSKDYYVQVDTGSDIFWLELKLYDPNESETAKLIPCTQDFCSATYDGPVPGCTPDLLCEYKVVYGDGSSSVGYFVKDTVQLGRVSGNLATAVANTSIIFGCGAKQSGDLGSSYVALDGLVGFGKSNSSLISQLAASGKVRKMFSHCLDGQNGGGIFAIGRVVQPKLSTTPMVPNQQHYNVNLTAIEVGKAFLPLPSNIFDTGNRKGTIIDSGTTLAYLPQVIYEPLINKIMSNHSDDKLFIVEGQFSCLRYSDRYISDRPISHIQNLVLSNKLVFYDLENQVIGWTEYNCSSTIKLQDEQSGVVYQVGPHDLSSACRLYIGRFILLLIQTIIFLSSIW
ncbi:hypothetical protein Syun_006053 [Stephania yunnanensis]|uniref:Peptidase A1 domain-containing protein n=1 Tax=Stephania yunnanensis TaxID=152371 RepID=A0AAP0PX67_9MAGN